ncbi:dTDP-4-dehydrorhamnose 3,5-epimerase [Thalassospira marina]|uniref:dTDP-4-dehydrorhamnose 3,5-epimerase n=1 Tax=Thalassospira marina TaxID=2048283 RepID=A0A2N3KVM6_9PROT|nr:dTDP-4-dehydrorhamnose 3,5-epimerase [Thalassospira marina]PKR54577.1 dTDP-4-dehydrorhamnose 3,5-epimerase [Thalassospira marina]
MSRFKIIPLPLEGLRQITRQYLGDNRGFFSRIFCAEELSSAGWCKPISQINHTQTSKQGSVRGMHFQLPPYAEAKLVTCIRGEVWDVAVDLRKNSSTFLQWHAERLSAENGKALLIPEGFAHGFQTLTADAELLYCHSAPYAPSAEGGLNPQDPALEINWPMAITEISNKDGSHPMLNAQFQGVVL